ncbi:MAG: ISAs1 family transposase [Anaerolineales bacterium]|nr:MAG: ISAs1 family transposase [Anaerolineales bacterium]
MMQYNMSRVEYNLDRQEFVLGEFVFDLKGLYAYLERLNDGRDPRGVRYQLADALTLIILAKLGGEDEPRGMADWLRHRAEVLVRALKLARASMPHAVTISRILGRAVDVEELERVLARYLDGQVQTSQAIVVAIDGKVLRGTIEVGHSQGLHLLAAYLPEEGLVLMQVEVDNQANEIVAAPNFVEVLDLRVKVVVGDAMHTQRNISMEIVSHGGDYIWTAKGNQAEVQETIAHLFEPEPVTPGFAPTPTDFESASTVDKGHGRLERRTLTSSRMLKDYLDWPYLEQVFKLERRFTHLKTGEVTLQISYGLTSLSPDQASPEQLLHYLRTYWGIENGLHYRRDVTFKEDQCRLRIGHAARTMATLNNLVLTLILRQGYTNVPDARRRYAARPLDALKLIFQQP